jgi:hypothetical protein
MDVDVAPLRARSCRTDVAAAAPDPPDDATLRVDDGEGDG